MPPQQHRLEGSDLESLLAQVGDRFGDAATIVEANRLRRGGVAGFFAKEQFEVVVDVHGATSPDDVADEDGPAPTPPAPAGRSLLDWADEVVDGEPPRETVSTEGGGFADVLARLTQAAAEADTDAPQAAQAEGDGSVIDLSEPFETWPEVVAAREAATTRPVAPTTSSTTVARTEAPTRELARLDIRPLVAAGIPADLALRGESETDLPHAILRALEQVPQPAPLPDLPGAVIAVVGERRAAIALGRQLADELGLAPDTMLLASGRYHGSAFDENRRVDTVEAAAERRLGLRRRPGATVVVVDATAARRDGAWACQMLDSLEPTMTWATVEAARKPEDVQAWARTLGGVDALAVTDLDQTVSPAAILQTGMPVGRLDGAMASPTQWAAVLIDRLAA